jgi:hypothetical protein
LLLQNGKYDSVLQEARPIVTTFARDTSAVTDQYVIGDSTDSERLECDEESAHKMRQ